MKNSCKILIITLLTFLPVFLSGNNTNNEKDSIHSVNLYRAGRELALIHHFMESTDSLLRSLELRKKIYGPNAYRRFAGVYRIIATNYKNIGLTERAIEFSNFAEEAYKKGYGENYRNIAYVYLNMGNIYRSKLNYNEALRYYNQMINILLTQPDRNFQMLAEGYYSIAEIYYKIHKYDEAISIIEKQINNANIRTKIYYFDLLGGIYQELRDTLKAENSYKKAIESAIRFSNEFNNSYNLNVAYEYLNFASFLIETGKIDQADKILKEAYPIIMNYEKTEGKNLSFYYRAKAKLLENKHIESNDVEVFRIQKHSNLLSAISWYQKALGALGFYIEDITKVNLDSINCISELRCVELIKLIADDYMEIAGIFENRNVRFFQSSITKALKYYNVAGLMVQQLRKEIVGDENKMQLTELEYSTFTKTVEACYKAYQFNDNNYYIEEAFNNAERNKSSSLFDKLSDQWSKENSLIPDSLIEREKILNSAIATFTEDLFSEQKSENPNHQQIVSLDSSLFRLKNQRSELDSYLKNNYKGYYALKYSNNLLSIPEIQSHLHKDEILLEYILNETDTLPKLYVIFVSPLKVRFVKQEIDQQFLSNIDETFRFMANPRYMFTKNEDSKKFCVASNKLYKNLIAPFAKDLKDKKLIIVPDGKINYIAFDALLSSLPDTTSMIDFSKLDYLIKQNTINYGFSANLLFNFSESKEKVKKKVLAFAPIYKNETVSIDNQKLTLVALPGIQKEVRLISKKIKTTEFLGDDATEMNFRKNSGQYEILHLAMHAFINDSLPAFSQFAFTQPGETDNNNNGWLNTAEIYNLNLHAKLTVLSACNTGSGRLRKGEGITSLARGFTYAGCPSVVMTLWETEDNSGTQIMNFFYKNLKRGKAKDDALRLAKLEYLKHSNSRLAHPHYWLGYVCIGDNSPLFRSYDFYFLGFLILALLGILTDQILRMKKARKKRAQ